MLNKLPRNPQLNTPWSKEEDALLRKHHADGLSAKNSYRRGLSHRSLEAIKRRRVKLKLTTRRKFTKEDDKALTKLYARYVTLDEIAKELKRSTGVVQQRVMLLGLHRDARITKLVMTHGPGILKKGDTYEAMLASIGHAAQSAVSVQYDAALLKKAFDHLMTVMKEVGAITARDKMSMQLRAQRDTAIRNVRASGATLDSIADVTGLSHESVRRISLGLGTGQQLSIARKLAAMVFGDYQATLALAKQLRESKK